MERQFLDSIQIHLFYFLQMSINLDKVNFLLLFECHSLQFIVNDSIALGSGTFHYNTSNFIEEVSFWLKTFLQNFPIMHSSPPYSPLCDPSYFKLYTSVIVWNFFIIIVCTTKKYISLPISCEVNFNQYFDQYLPLPFTSTMGDSWIFN